MEEGGYNSELNAVLAMVQGSGDQKFYWETRNNTSAHGKNKKKAVDAQNYEKHVG